MATRCAWPPGELADRKFGERSQADQVEGFACARSLFALAHTSHPQPEGDVLEDVEVRGRCVGLRRC